MFAGLGPFLAKPAVQTGLVLGGIAAVRAYQPSLMSRTRNDQALIVAGSIASGYVAGNSFERVVGALSAATGSHRAVPAGVIGAAAVIARRTELPPATRAAAGVAGAAALVSGALALNRGHTLGRAAATLQGVVAGAAAAAGLIRQLRSYPDDGRPMPATGDVTASLTTGIAMAAGAWGVIGVERAIAGAAARTAASRLGGPRPLWYAGAHLAMLGAAAAGGRFAAGRFVRSLDVAADQVEPGYAAAPSSALLSGGPGSALDHGTLGVAGRRFVGEVRTAEEINRVMGIDSAIDPIRVFVGIDSAATIEARVALAMSELRRTGAFERSLLIVGSPSGSGYLNYIAVEAAEFLTAGDVVTVTIQYGKLPSLLSLGRVEMAREQHAALVEAIADELEWRSPTERPRFVLYGESLGAQTSQEAFRDPGFDALGKRQVDNTLWVGTPYPTRFRRVVLSTDPPDERFEQPSKITEHDPATQYTFLDHHEDPVTLFTPSIFYRPPPWLGPPADRPPNVSRTQRWVPAVTFWLLACDTKNATEIVPGEFDAYGHDYRADLADFVRAIYAIPGVDDEQMASVERALHRSEVERASRIARH
jgi:uncharacterized membrane protein